MGRAVLTPLSLFVLFATCAAKTDKVDVKYYGESGCARCREFVSGALNQTFAEPSVASLMDFDFVPWGNAYFGISVFECAGMPGDDGVPLGSYDINAAHCYNDLCGLGASSPPADCYTGRGDPKGPYGIVCEHGREECEYNLYFACARDLYPVAETYMPFVTCMEAKYGGVTSSVDVAKFCAVESGLDINKVETCFDGDAGSKLSSANAASTPIMPNDAGPGSGQDGVLPYVTVNGKALKHPSTLLYAVCDAYTGPLPMACRKLLQVPNVVQV